MDYSNMRHDGKHWYRFEAGEWVRVKITPWERTGPVGKVVVWLIVLAVVGFVISLIW